MRLLAHVPGFPPSHLGGAERSLEETLIYLRTAGHDVNVLLPPGTVYPPAAHPEIPVRVAQSTRQIYASYSRADVILTQLSVAPASLVLAATAGRPVVYLSHNVGDVRFLPSTPDLTVYNADWQRQLFSNHEPNTVLHPPIDVDRYRVEPGEHLTLVNYSSEKGASIFDELSRRLPAHRFLAVSHLWGSGSVRPRAQNVELIEPQQDARVVYAKTRVLLVPTVFRCETFGRVALEAAASGIPVIATPGPGIHEALGDTGIYVKPEAIDDWVAAILELDEPDIYRARSRAIAERAAAYSAQADLELVHNELVELAR